MFGDFGIATLGETSLLVLLTYTDVIAIDTELAIRWIARDTAIDGLLFCGADGDKITLRAEMDPPGGWFDVVLDAATGHEISRVPNFLPGYVGLHGQGPPESR